MPYRYSSTTGNLIKPRPECLNTSTGAIIRPLLYSIPFEMWNGVVEYYTLSSPSQFYDPTKAYDGDVNTLCSGETEVLSPQSGSSGMAMHSEPDNGDPTTAQN